MRSFEEFIFEAASWLLFYPLTLWRVLLHPLRTMAYSDAEQAMDTERQYDSAISPPLFLLITVILVNLIGDAIHHGSHKVNGHVASVVMASPQTFALVRSLVFSLVPLIAAARLVKRQGLALSRSTLQPPFYAQCYLAAPCAVATGLGVSLLMRHEDFRYGGAVLWAAGTIWFLAVQTRWFALKLGVGRLRAFLIAVRSLLEGFAYLLVLLIPLALL